MRGQDLKLLLVKSGDICAFPGCGSRLTLSESVPDSGLFVGQIAHIVGDSAGGPRGTHPLPMSERDLYSNLILLCRDHHHLIDSQEATYTVERLRAMKEQHEAAISRTLDHFRSDRDALPAKTETVYSTLLPVSHMPSSLFSVDCDLTSDEQVRQALGPIKWPEMAPFILRENRLYAFHRLDDKTGPFADIVGAKSVSEERALDWWDDPVRSAWFLDLSRSALNKLTGRKGLQLDREHRRYFFVPTTQGQERAVNYRTLNGRRSTRKVVWQPISKRTGLGRGYWYHYAISLRFLRASRSSWYLSLRPEFRVTKDGLTPIEASKIGSKVTRKQARIFNYDLLGEVHFWRDYLSDSRPRIVLPFGHQNIAIPTTLLAGEVSWPGMPDVFAKKFTNVAYSEDMFDVMERLGLGEPDADGGWEDDDDDDSEA